MEEKKCGRCRSFDINNAEGKEFEPTVKDGGISIKCGVCRINKGLIFGLLDETIFCKQPDFFFPRNSNQAS